MIQKDFAERATKILSGDPFVIGLTVGGSWLSATLDEFSDVDLILVTKEKISHDPEKMIEYARRLGNFLCGFTGEHVGEPRVLICLYDNPLLHVDIKFLVADEFRERVETPVILMDRHDVIHRILRETESKYPFPNHQWIEDRFWIWVHYILLKIGRGEFFEAYDCFGFLRAVVFGPFLLVKNGSLPNGVRKVERLLSAADLEKLKSTLPSYTKQSLFATLKNSVALYSEIRTALFDSTTTRRTETETRVRQYLREMGERIGMN